jgi:hypothetical protein
VQRRRLRTLGCRKTALTPVDANDPCRNATMTGRGEQPLDTRRPSDDGKRVHRGTVCCAFSAVRRLPDRPTA